MIFQNNVYTRMVSLKAKYYVVMPFMDQIYINLF